MMEELKKRIKSGGYWKIILRPVEFLEKKIPSLIDCKNIIGTNAIRYRGWEFPIINHEHYNNLNNGIESFIELKQFRECWEFYQSGQFVFHSSFYEDDEKDEIKKYASFPMAMNEEDISKGNFQCIEFIINRITILFDFIEKITKMDVLGNEFLITIELNNVKERVLFFYKRSRLITIVYKCKINEIKYEEKFEKLTFLNEKDNLIIACCEYIFERFNCYFDKKLINELINEIRKANL